MEGFDRLAFRSAAWVLLFVIFVFALLPGGFSQTLLPGSAFDPSSSVVSLKEASRQAEERKAAVQPDGKPDGFAVTDAELPALPAVCGPDIIALVAERRACPPPPGQTARFPDGLPGSPFRARAPPLA